MQYIKKMKTADSLIINIPVILALLLMTGAAITGWVLRGVFPAAIGFGILAWQALAGAVLLTLDYKKRKIALFFRILDSCDNETKLALLTKPLKGTLCGEVMRLAIWNRFKTEMK
jgi:hypothetical protein